LKIQELHNYSYTILGGGRSGIAIARLLNQKGVKVFLSDNSNNDKLMYMITELLQSDNIEFETGGHSDRIYENDIFIVSPGIPMNAPVIEKALKLNKKIYGEIEAAYWFCNSEIVAITGTNSKTTTTVLTGEIFRNAGYDTKVCGNVGTPFASIVSDTNESSKIILEISSFQLETIESFRPRVSMLLNITPDHIDRHKGFDNYALAKMKINMNQKNSDVFVYNFDDPSTRNYIGNVNGQITSFSALVDLSTEGIGKGCYVKNGTVIYFDTTNKVNENIIAASDIYVKGMHNVYNSMAAIIAAKQFGISNEIIADTLKTFKGVEHRIEFVDEINGAKYYNDSKATNFDSLTVALESFPKNIVLIMGGMKGDNKFEKVNQLIAKKVKEILAIGETKKDIKEYFKNYVTVNTFNDLKTAVEHAYKTAVEGDSVLFSPAYKSFDMFDNYEHRGQEFKSFVNNIKTGKS